MSDVALVLRARAGDEVAFRRLLKRYENTIGQFASEYFIYCAERQDVKQEGAYGLLKAVHSYKPEAGSSFRSFACLCIRRQIITAVKTATRGKHGPLNHALSFGFQTAASGEDDDSATLADILPCREPEPHARLEQEEEISTIRSTLTERLTPMERISILGIAEGISYDSIAEQVGCQPKAVDNAAQRARKKLSAALEAA